MSSLRDQHGSGIDLVGLGFLNVFLSYSACYAEILVIFLKKNRRKKMMILHPNPPPSSPPWLEYFRRKMKVVAFVAVDYNRKKSLIPDVMRS